jgi:hypothetical protein
VATSHGLDEDRDGEHVLPVIVEYEELTTLL